MYTIYSLIYNFVLLSYVSVTSCDVCTILTEILDNICFTILSGIVECCVAILYNVEKGTPNHLHITHRHHTHVD